MERHFLAQDVVKKAFDKKYSGRTLTVENCNSLCYNKTDSFIPPAQNTPPRLVAGMNAKKSLRRDFSGWPFVSTMLCGIILGIGDVKDLYRYYG